MGNALMAPPIVPNLTQLGPEKMRSVMQSLMSGPSPDDEDMEAETDAEPQLPPAEIIAQVGRLAYEATKYEGLPQTLLSLIRTVINGVNKVNMGGMLPQQPGILAPPRVLSSPAPELGE